MSSDALALAIEVTDVTEGGVPPVMISAASASVAENTAGTVYVAQADDPDSANVTFFISGGADAGLFAIDETTGELSFLVSPDYESSDRCVTPITSTRWKSLLQMAP